MFNVFFSSSSFKKERKKGVGFQFHADWRWEKVVCLLVNSHRVTQPNLLWGYQSLWEDRRCNCPSIVRSTVAAFLSNYMEEDLCCVVAVITQNPYLPISVVLGHDSLFNLLIYSLPDSGHVNYWLGTYGAAIVVTLYHLMVAFTVHGMPTFHNSCVFQRIK